MDQIPPDDAAEDGAFARHHPTLRLLRHDELVSSRLVKADTRWSRMRGLLGRDALAPSEGLWITPCNSIHMFFMRHGIDAVFVDDQLTVVRVAEHLRPWRMARGGKAAHSVLELPPGTASRSGIRIGDRLRILPD